MTLPAKEEMSSKTEDQPLLENGDDDSCGHSHVSHRAPWLRACVLGANDGLVSVSCLLLGIAGGGSDEPDTSRKTILLSAVAGLVAGALSMAVGEYISVSSQRDAEEADINLERMEHAKGPAARARELEELIQIYIDRGLTPGLAKEVATELTERNDPVVVHARDELGIDVDDLSNPWQAAGLSGLSFSVGAAVPIIPTLIFSTHLYMILAIIVFSMCALIAFGAIGAQLGGASKLKGGIRVLVGGSLAMGITYGIGRLFQIVIAKH